MFSLGVTGSFGSGKSTVAAMLARHGAAVVDADQIVHRLLSLNGKCVKAVVRSFGKDILKSGRIDRKALAQKVFADSRHRRALERIIHPQVIREIHGRLKGFQRSKRHTVVVLDVPLLFEAGLDRLVDAVVVVKASPPIQERRLRKRIAMTHQEFLKRLKAQMPLSKKIAQADFVVDNSGSLKETRRQVKKIWERISQIIFQ